MFCDVLSRSGGGVDGRVEGEFTFLDHELPGAGHLHPPAAAALVLGQPADLALVAATDDDDVHARRETLGPGTKGGLATERTCGPRGAVRCVDEGGAEGAILVEHCYLPCEQPAGMPDCWLVYDGFFLACQISAVCG